MSKKTESLHERAEAYRRSAEDACADFNEEAEREAVEEFEDGEIAQYFRENAKYIIGLVVKRLEAVKDGEPTMPIRAFDADTLVQLLTSVTEVEHEAMGYDEDLSDEETVELGKCDKLFEANYVTTSTTFASGNQDDLRDALVEYAQTAAAYAKTINSVSLMDWAGMLDILQNKSSEVSSHLRQEDALRLVALEKSAANRLRLDKIIAELPPFKPSKKAKKAS